MSDVEAKHRLGEFSKITLCSSNVRPIGFLRSIFSMASCSPVAPPDGKGMDRVGMRNDGPIARHKSPQEVDDLHFLAGIEAARRMDRFVFVCDKRELSKSME